MFNLRRAQFRLLLVQERLQHGDQLHSLLKLVEHIAPVKVQPIIVCILRKLELILVPTLRGGRIEARRTAFRV